MRRKNNIDRAKKQKVVSMLISFVRQKTGLSLTDLERKCGVPGHTFYDIHSQQPGRNKENPKQSNEKLFSAAKDLLSADLLSGDDKRYWEEEIEKAFHDESKNVQQENRIVNLDDSEELSKQIGSVRHAVAEQACRLDDIDKARQELSIECRRTRDAFQDWKKIHDIKDGERENQIDSIANDLAVLMRILHEAFPMLPLPKEMNHD